MNNIRIILLTFFLLMNTILVLNIIDNNLGVSATDLTVDYNGGGDYTKIQDAINASSNGDTIYVWDGTYTENVIVNKSVTIIGNGTANTILDCNNNAYGFSISSMSFINISGFNITDCSNKAIQITNSDNLTFSDLLFYDDVQGIYGTNVTDVNVSNNVFDIIDYHSIRFDGGSDTVYIYNNSFYDICNIDSAGIYGYYSDNFIVDLCVFDDVGTGYGMYFDGVDHLDVLNCDVSNVDSDGLIVYLYGSDIHINIDNITMDNISDTGITFGASGYPDHTLNITNCSINNAGQTPINLNYNNNTFFYNNVITNSTISGAISLYYSNNTVISYTDISDTVDDAIDMDHCKNVNINNCTLTDINGSFMYSDTGINLDIIDNFFYGFTAGGYHTVFGLELFSGNTVTIYNNSFDNEIEFPIYSEEVNNYFISNNNFTTTYAYEAGLWLAGNNNESYVICDNFFNCGIYFGLSTHPWESGKDIAIYNNTFEDLNAITDGMEVGDSDNVSIYNNTLDGIGDVGIYCGVITNLTFYNNDVNDTVEEGIYFYNCNDFSIYNCSVGNTSMNSIYIYYGENIIIHNNNINNVTSFNSACINIDEGINITIHNNSCNPVYVQSTYESTGIAVSDVNWLYINDNDVWDAYLGINTGYNENISMSGNTVTDIYADGIALLTDSYYFNVSNNDISDFGDEGIALHYAYNGYLYNNTIYEGSDSSTYGVELDYCENITSTSDTIYNVRYGIWSTSTLYNMTITNVNIYNCDDNGVEIYNCIYLNVTNSNISNCPTNGLDLEDVENLIFSNNNIINCPWYGLFLYNVNNITMSDNYFYNSTVECQTDSTPMEDYIINDNFFDCGGGGEAWGFVFWGGHYNNISFYNNNIVNVTWFGLLLRSGTFENCSVYNNGIYANDTHTNSGSNDYIWMVEFTSEVYSDVNNCFYNNTISCTGVTGLGPDPEDLRGIYLDPNYYSFVYNNTITGCRLGIEILGHNNTVYNNYFDNTKNAVIDNVYAVDNNWNITKTLGTNIIGGPYLGGNYWSDYTGEDLTNDGLGDTELPYNDYLLYGGDYHPLVYSNFLNVCVYNESNCSQAVLFDLLISNRSGTVTFESLNNWECVSIPITSMPYGEDIIVLVSSSNKTYNFRIYYIDLDPSQNFSLTAYLPPRYTGGGPLDESLQSFEDTAAVLDPDQDVIVYTTYDIYSVFRVEVYNSSLYETYGGWVIISHNHYTYNETQVTVDDSILDNYSVMVKVTYYYKFTPIVADSYLYYFNVVSEEISYGVSPPINSAKVTLKTYINCTDRFETISTLYTDGNGECSVYLVPGRLYKIFINKSGYYNETDDYVPDYTFYGSQHPKVFKITHLPNVWDELDEIGFDSMTLTAYNNTTMRIDYFNKVYNNSYVNLTIYDYFNSSVLKYYNVSSFPNNFTLYFTYGDYYLVGSLLRVKAIAYRLDGSTYTFSKYFNTEQPSGGVGSAAIAAILSIGICLFGLTLAHPKRVLGVVGIIVLLIALAITAFADQSFWWIHLVQAIELILLIFVVLVFREEGIHAI